MGETEITAFLSHLAVKKRVTASTRNQALSGLLFLYKGVPKKPLEWMDKIERAKKPSRMPVVFTQDEVRSIMQGLQGTKWLGFFADCAAKTVIGQPIRRPRSAKKRDQLSAVSGQLLDQSGEHAFDFDDGVSRLLVTFIFRNQLVVVLISISG